MGTGNVEYWHLIRCMGIRWLGYRTWYALQRKSGWFIRRLPSRPWGDKPLAYWLRDTGPTDPSDYLQYRRTTASSFFFDPQLRSGSSIRLDKFDEQSLPPSNTTPQESVILQADRILAGVFTYFSRHKVNTGFPPDWFRNPFQPNRTITPSMRAKHWSKVADFAQGDMKLLWELSRFGFAYPLVHAYWRTGDEKYAEAFWTLVEDWRAHNPPQCGPNWKCGQEIAFRIMAWCFGLYGFLDASPTRPERLAMLAEMIATSAERIEANLRYALSQRNNHGISEAAGLWSVGTLFPEFRKASHWQRRGRAILERLARELIYKDGTFCQHSASYHRLMLHDYLWAVCLAKRNGESFSAMLMERLQRAAVFLREIMDPDSGRVPMFGANDGTLLLPLSNCDYLDFRPVVQAAHLLTTGERCLPPGAWDEDLFWLGLDAAETAPLKTERPQEKQASVPARTSVRFEPGGYVILRGKTSWAMIRCTPKYQHRPSHADQLHLDLWWNSLNVLRDSGSFSYNAPHWDTYFTSTAAHSTIEFDGRDQMPRLGRFLFGQWLPVKTVAPLTESEDRCTWAGGYRDWCGCSHERHVEVCVSTDTWRVTDRISGFREKAVLRWRLAPELGWHLDGNACSANGIVLRIDIASEPFEIALTKGWESLYYWEKTEVPVLEATLSPSCDAVTTTVSFRTG